MAGTGAELQPLFFTHPPMKNKGLEGKKKNPKQGSAYLLLPYVSSLPLPNLSQ